tara:strand:+ start:3963 stop:4532 length:570 start_codon:yes stop_codon:yes gene_type:complete
MAEGLLEEIFESAEESGALSVSEGIANETSYLLSNENIIESEVNDFADLVLEDPANPGAPEVPPSKLVKWLKSVKGTTWLNIGIQASMVGIMLYTLIANSIKHAQNGGKRISLKAAIEGAKKTLVDEHDKTVVAIAQAIKDGPTWDSMSDTDKKVVEEAIAESGEVFWLKHADDIMTSLAQTPIYDPTA